MNKENTVIEIDAELLEVKAGNRTTHYLKLTEPAKLEVLRREARERSLSNYVAREVRSVPCETDTNGRNFAADIEPTDIRTERDIESAHSRNIDNVRDILGIGRFLTLKKVELGHGNWLDYVEARPRILPFGHAWASQYMRIWEHQRAISTVGRTMSMKGCLRLCDKIEGKQRKETKQVVVSKDQIKKYLKKYLAKCEQQAGAEHVKIVQDAWLTALSEILNEQWLGTR